MFNMFYKIIIENGSWLTMLKGLFATVKISVFALLFGSILGGIICAMRLSRSKILKTIAQLYIAILRGSPVLMLLMLMYYVILAKSPLSANSIAIITFALNTAAYVAELLRTAISATDEGQVEAARTLGFSKTQAFSLVTFPQAMKIAKPVYESTIVNMIQWTSVVGYVTITDLTRVINNMSARTMQPVFMIVIGMLIYLALSYLVKGIFRIIDIRAEKKEAKKQEIQYPAVDPQEFENAVVSKNSNKVAIEIRNLYKSFGTLKVLENVNTDINQGEIIAVLGASGCGKSVFLRLTEQLVTADKGTIKIFGDEITKKGADVDSIRRRMGMVYQNFNLFSHMTVMDNMCLAPCKLLKMPREEAERKAIYLLQIVGLSDRAGAMPSNLSGGQKQRIAIARCLMMDPEILLFDEPTSALDPTMVGEVLATIRMLSKRGYTMMIVTHEMNFAREVANRIMFFADRNIYEQGTPTEIFEHPKKEQTINFIMKLKTYTHEIRNTNFDLMSLSGGINSFCDKYGLSSKKSYIISLCAEELAYEYLSFLKGIEPCIDYKISYSELDKSMSILFTSKGEAYNPFDAEEELDHLGITIIKNAGLSHEYTYENNTNIIRFTL